MHEAFNKFVKEIDNFLEKECFKTNKKTGKKTLTPFGVNLLIYCSFVLYIENCKLRKEGKNVW